MKLTNFSFYIFSALLLFASGCKESFLEGPKPTDGSVSEVAVFESKEGIEAAFVGIYAQIREYGPSGAKQNMYGIKTIQLNFDLRGADVMARPAQWWIFEYSWTDNLYGRNPTSLRTLQMWELFFKTINNANAIIKGVTERYQGPEAEKTAYIAEARALRAFAYYNLARIYQFGYAKNPEALGLPVYESPADASSEGAPRSSLREVYRFAEEDLKFAVTNLSKDRLAKFRINKDVAHAFLANLYLEMAMADPSLWPQVEAHAKEARAGYPLMSGAAYKAGFNDIANGEWMWGLSFNPDQAHGYASFWAFIDFTSGGYDCIFINSDFKKLFTATDARNTFTAPPGFKEGDPAWSQWITTKFRTKGGFNGDYVIARAAEFYLVEAEALAQQGKLAEAKALLFELQKARDPQAAASNAATKEALIDEILVERRKELYAETGVGFFDLKRYQRPLVRTGNAHAMLAPVPADDKRWIYQIPEAEIDANKNLKGQQNE